MCVLGGLPTTPSGLNREDVGSGAHDAGVFDGVDVAAVSVGERDIEVEQAVLLEVFSLVQLKETRGPLALHLTLLVHAAHHTEPYTFPNAFSAQRHVRSCSQHTIRSTFHRHSCWGWGGGWGGGWRGELGSLCAIIGFLLSSFLTTTF